MDEFKKLRDMALEYKKLHGSSFHGIEHYDDVAYNVDLIVNAEDMEFYRKDGYLFAYTHDLGRETEGFEPEHGVKSADIARVILPEYFPEYVKDKDRYESLLFAIEHHSNIALAVKNGLRPIIKNFAPSENIDPMIFALGTDADQLALMRWDKIQHIGLKTKYLSLPFSKEYANSDEHKKGYR